MNSLDEAAALRDLKSGTGETLAWAISNLRGNWRGVAICRKEPSAAPHLCKPGGSCKPKLKSRFNPP